jgi:uroporphyrinogen decarboxylase
VLYFKGRRNGFMPEYLDHPVKDIASWVEKCLWRMDPATPRRYADLAPQIDGARLGAARGFFICQRLVGGYMYLRSLIGPGELLYKVCEDPELIHACMRAWFSLADAIIAHNQKSVTFDEIFFAEDICYNHGPLISPDMMHEYLFPYYQQLIANMKARRIDQSRHLYVEVDTDGWCTPIIDVYREAIGMDVLSPFEVASGCDVVEIGARYPELIMSGGVDKRVLAEGKEAIDRHVDRIFPAMRGRGGYMPTCDHGVPAEVSLENYMHYRKRCREFA